MPFVVEDFMNGRSDFTVGPGAHYVFVEAGKGFIQVLYGLHHFVDQHHYPGYRSKTFRRKHAVAD